MARILPCYSLCPLIEQKSFLGLTEDAKTDTVLVTANSNIIGRYRVSDPKQISSWNSKGSITCAAVYDKLSETYVGVFNHNEMRLWSITDESIDKVKKYKFAEKIYGLLTSPETGKTIIVFISGNASYLDTALEKRKNKLDCSRLEENEKIKSFEVISYSNSIIVSLLISSESSYRILGIVPDQQENIFNFTFPKKGKLLGNSLLLDKNLDCITLWSDGKLYRQNLLGGNQECKCLTVFQDRESEHLAAVKTLSPYSVAVCYLKSDGLILQVYSVKYNLIQCKQFYEDCLNASPLWNFETKLFLIMGHNLVAVPYVQENRKLSTLIGTNVGKSDDVDLQILPETAVCSQKVPELIENNDANGILELINSLQDLPDSVIIDILLWSFKKKKYKKVILETVLLRYSINDVSVLNRSFNVDESLELLEFVITNLSRYNDNLKLIKWASLLIDAFYQQYMISGDKNVLDRLTLYLSTLKSECGRLEDYKEISSTVSCIERKKVILSK